MRELLSRLLRIGRTADMERRLEEEMRFHIDMAADRHVREGVPAAEARRLALAEFGGKDRVREEARDEVRSPVMPEMWRDVRYALRTLRRAPTFTLAVVGTLGLGIAATTVVFSVADHIAIRPLAFPESDRLVVVREVIVALRETYPSMPANASHFLEWQQRCEACEGVGVMRTTDLTLTGGDDPELLGAVRASPSLFAVLGARAALGRVLLPEDDERTRKVVVLADPFWRRRFGADPSIVGRDIQLNGEAWTVVGVMPPSFHLPKRQELGTPGFLPDRIDVLVPLSLSERERTTPGEYDYAVIARLKQGVTPEQAKAQLDAIQTAIAERSPRPMELEAVVTPLRTQVVGTAGRALLLMLAAVAAVLGIVCVNLANLLLARNAGRIRESAVRLALGASRTRLVRQALVESVLLAVLGGIAGVIAANWGLAALLRLAPADMPRLAEVRLDGRVLATVAMLVATAGLAFGTLPALRFASADPGDALKSAGSRSATGGRRAARGRATLIGAQAALSTLLLVVAGLFMSSFVRVLRVDKGFDVEQVLALDVTLPAGSYATHERKAQYHDEARRRAAAVPGVVSSATTNAIPLGGEYQVDVLSLENDTRPATDRPVANVRYVSPEYFSTVGTPLRRGRLFTEADRGQNVVVISERAAQALWPGEDPIGKRVVPGSNDPLAEVVGVVADVRTSSLEKEGSLVAYVPDWRYASNRSSLLVRTVGEPADVSAAVVAELRRVDPTVPVPRVRTMASVVSEVVAQRRFQLVMLALFAAAALLTATIGIYGLVAHSLSRRAGEMGIRMALGARPTDVHRLVLREGLTPVLAGLVVGVVASIALGRVLSALLFEVRPGDPLPIAAAALTITAAAAAACLVPARRVTRRDALEALRLE